MDPENPETAPNAPAPADGASTPNGTETPAVETAETKEQKPAPKVKDSTLAKYGDKTAEELLVVVEEWIGKSRANEDLKKENHSSLTALQSEYDKLSTKYTSTERELATLKAEVEAQAVASKREKAVIAAGLDVELVEFITASDESEIKAQAAKLAARLGTTGEDAGKKQKNVIPNAGTAKAPTGGEFGSRFQNFLRNN